ncbi:VOC family protein [Actinophytocola sp.]|uniref:VOC family protein n=1 Tax=Actinophytocola sp. TaxID=1872138 RepID=UPI003D6B2EAF
MITISRFIHVNIVCRDLVASLNFYVDVLGAKVHEIFASGDSDLRNVMGVDSRGAPSYRAALVYWGASKRGPYLDLVQWIGGPDDGRPPLRAQDCGLVRVALQVDDVDQVAAELADRGVPLVGPVHEAPVGPWLLRLVLCTDPDGTLIELVSFTNGETRADRGTALTRQQLAELASHARTVD